MDLNNPKHEELIALAYTFSEAPGVIPSMDDLATIAFKWFAAHFQPQEPRPLEGWWRRE